jgi:glycerophosphoryl diester phosphodiesterase
VYFKEIRPDVPTGIIWTDSPELPWSLRWGAGAWLSACDFLKPDRKVLSKPGILWLGEGRKRDVIPWTVDESALAQVLAERKMAGIITNRPQDMKAFYS